MNSNLIYTFNAWNNTSFKLVKPLELPDTDYYFLNSFNVFEKKVIAGKYKKIVGVGDYRKGAKRLKIETRFTKDNEILWANWKPELDKDSYYSENAGTGNCNKSGFVVMKAIEEYDLDTLFTFIHLPKKHNLESFRNYIRLIL